MAQNLHISEKSSNFAWIFVRQRTRDAEKPLLGGSRSSRFNGRTLRVLLLSLDLTEAVQQRAALFGEMGLMGLTGLMGENKSFVGRG